MVLNYITIFSLEANRSNECLLGERKLALWLLWEEASFGEKSFVQWAVSSKRYAAPRCEQQLMQSGRDCSEEQGVTGGYWERSLRSTKIMQAEASAAEHLYL